MSARVCVYMLKMYLYLGEPAPGEERLVRVQGPQRGEALHAQLPNRMRSWTLTEGETEKESEGERKGEECAALTEYRSKDGDLEIHW